MNDHYFDDRCKYYYTFQDIVGRDNRNALIKQLRRIQNLLVKLQTKFIIIRHTNMTLYKGANWFSITNGMAKYILDKYQIKGLVFGLGDIKEEEQDMGCTLKHFTFFRIRYDF